MQDRSQTRFMAAALQAERTRAEAHLWAEMAAAGLRKQDGWSIVEFTREVAGGTQIVLRPLHLYLPSPTGLECVVGVVEDGARIESHCKRPDEDSA